MASWLNRKIQWLISGREPWPADELFGHTIHDREWRFGFEVIRYHPWVSLYCLLVSIACLVSAINAAGDWFARLGALVVSCGILLELTAGKRFRLHAERQRLADFVRALDERNAEFIAEYLYQYVVREQRGQYVSPPSVEASLNRLKPGKNREAVAIMLETAFVILGTLIWAFGDWFVCSLHTWSFSKC